MSNQNDTLTPSNKASLINDFYFLFDSWRAILFAVSLGLGAAFFYILSATNYYQATAQIQMAQISSINSSNSNSGSNSSPLGTSIEEPKLLLERLKQPTNFSKNETFACGFTDDQEGAESLISSVIISELKGVPSVIQLRVRNQSRATAISCSLALFENIKRSQKEIIKPYLEESKILLTMYQKRLLNAQSLIYRADQSGAALSAAYLASRDEIKFLNEEIVRLNTFISSGDARSAKLISPIYAPNSPVSPNKKAIMILGLISGLLIGIFFVFVRKLILAL